MSASEEIENMLRSAMCEDQKMNNLLKSMYSVREEYEYGAHNEVGMDRSWCLFLFYESLWGNDDYRFVSLVKRNPVEKINEEDLERVFNLVDEYLMKPMKQFVDLSTSSCFDGSDWFRSPRSSEYKEYQWRIASEDEWSE